MRWLVSNRAHGRSGILHAAANDGSPARATHCVCASIADQHRETPLQRVLDTYLSSSD
jgi:hypothetical protein